MWHALERTETEQGLDGKARRKYTTRKTEAKMDGNRRDLEETGWSGAWSGFGWLRTRTVGGLL
jgi:hypothetical protein